MLMNITCTECHKTKETKYTKLTPNMKLKTQKNTNSGTYTVITKFKVRILDTQCCISIKWSLFFVLFFSNITTGLLHWGENRAVQEVEDHRADLEVGQSS